MVPKRISPASARFRSAGTFSSSQRILLADSIRRPGSGGHFVAGVERSPSSWQGSSEAKPPEGAGPPGGSE